VSPEGKDVFVSYLCPFCRRIGIVGESSQAVAVIGAGLSGISAAQFLRSEGHRVVVFEKSRGFGGRCATKRWEGHVVDHGAQYFTIRDAGFREAVLGACGSEIVEISSPILTPGGEAVTAEERFFHRSGNSRLVRALADGLDVRTGIEVTPIVDRTIEGEQFDAILSTAPMPQTIRLTGRDGFPSAYIPSLTLLLLYDGDPAGFAADRYGVSDRTGHPLAWTACENHKPGRIQPGFTVMVAQASESFSREWLESPPPEWSEVLRKMVEERWELASASFRAMHPHRWRFARVATPLEVPELPEGWFFAGDALTESRVESAWLAGRGGARRVHSFLAE